MLGLLISCYIKSVESDDKTTGTVESDKTAKTYLSFFSF